MKRKKLKKANVQNLQIGIPLTQIKTKKEQNQTWQQAGLARAHFANDRDQLPLLDVDVEVEEARLTQTPAQIEVLAGDGRVTALLPLHVRLAYLVEQQEGPYPLHAYVGLCKN